MAEKPDIAGSATYEIVRARLLREVEKLGEITSQLETHRKEVFGGSGFALLQGDKITTAHPCVPQDVEELAGGRFLFGFTATFGLVDRTTPRDIFAVYRLDTETLSFHHDPETEATILDQPEFREQFDRIHRVYPGVTFRKFTAVSGGLFMVFRTGQSAGDQSVFYWKKTPGVRGGLTFADGRAESDYHREAARPSHYFAWRTPDRDSFRYGDFPHISLENRLFVDCVDGDLTFKIEDNTKTGKGIYAELVEDRKQKIDDAEISYATLGHLILTRIRPYKEREYRYFIFNEKLGEVVRVDSIGDSCVALPEDQGLIFPDGFYSSAGRLKVLARSSGHVIDSVIASPNGEDFLYAFYSDAEGAYVLLPYHLIGQTVRERIVCHGWCLFPDGKLLLFRSTTEEPQKHHSLQLRQTPFYAVEHEPPGNREAFLYSVGNKEVVRALAGVHEIMALARRDNPYPEQFADLVRLCGQAVDAAPWLRDLPDGAGAGLVDSLGRVREAANQAVDEFDKVLRQKKETAAKFAALSVRVRGVEDEIRRTRFTGVEDFATKLGELRALRGALAALREERYADVEAIAHLEQTVTSQSEQLARACTEFLLQPQSLAPYQETTEKLRQAAVAVQRVVEADKVEKSLAETSLQLETLVETLHALPLADATQTAAILETISALYAVLNQARAELRQKRRALGEAEARGKFAAAMRLLGQSTTNTLDLCDSPEKCDQAQARLGAQVQDLEAEFADFEEFVAEIAERREEITRALDQRKTSLLEARAQKAGAILAAAERLLALVGNRLAALGSPAEISAYLAADPVPAKIRQSIQQLLDLGDPLKADDLSTRLKAAGQQAVRQLKDREELFCEGADVIRIGRHRFHTNTQPLELTMVLRSGEQFLHLTGTRFFERIDDPEFLATREFWSMELISENAAVYRGETLAAKFLESLRRDAGGTFPASNVVIPTETEALTLVRAGHSLEPLLAAFMANRYEEGYTRGLHDHDAALLVAALLEMRAELGHSALPVEARCLARWVWSGMWEKETAGETPPNREFLQRVVHTECARLRAAGLDAARAPLPPALTQAIQNFVESWTGRPNFQAGLHEVMGDAVNWTGQVEAAARYLLLVQSGDGHFGQTQEAWAIGEAWEKFLRERDAATLWQTQQEQWAEDPEERWYATARWLASALAEHPERDRLQPYALETLTALFCQDKPITALQGATREIAPCRGSHPLIRHGVLALDFHDFHRRQAAFTPVAEGFSRYQKTKAALLEKRRRAMRLDSFRSKVLTSFVRNQLIDEVYFPLVGDNLAKQMGTAGDETRTDRSGLLLLVSPPGYGKTTLLEYLADRLGLLFVKINGPALGYSTVSLDPGEAPNAAAREEIERLNFAFETGDNILLCLDDIQHLSAEFLQKFISLCDAQRKIEGVWRGQAKTYDFRGRKVVVAMAGNPYTESGQKFRIPDMLANRADTYNLGDITGGHRTAFARSYIENAATSNSVLSLVAQRSQKDLQKFLRLAEEGNQGAAGGFEHAYSAQEVEEITATLRHLIRVRDALLAVNLQYIASAAQAEEFRTEPPFKLQGSYRNMNRLAEKILPALTPDEVTALLLDHYQNESQTLTADTEANLLKLRELWGLLKKEEAKRWEEIKEVFQRHQVTGKSDDPAARVAGQIALLGENLRRATAVLEEGLRRPAPSADEPETTPVRWRNLEHEVEMVHATLAAVQDLAMQQREKLEAARAELARRAKQGVVEFELTDEMLQDQAVFLQEFQEAMRRRRSTEEPPPKIQDPAE